MQEVNLAPHVQGVARLDLQHPHQVAKIASRPVHRVQDLCQNQVVVGVVEESLQCRHGVFMAWLQVEQSSIRLHRGCDVMQLPFPQLPETREQAHLLVLIARQLKLPLQIVRQIEVQSFLHEEAIECAQSGQATRVVAQRLLPRRNGLVGISDSLFPDGSNAGVNLLALVAGTDQLRLLPQDIDQIGPALGPRVQSFQRLECGGIFRLGLLCQAEVLDRLVRLVELLVAGHRNDQQDLALQPGR